MRHKFRYTLRRNRKKWLSQLVATLFLLFLALNGLCFIAAYGLTHYKEPGQWSIARPKPTSLQVPSQIGLRYQTRRIVLESPGDRSQWLDVWDIPLSRSKASQGTVLMFPGIGGTKGTQLLPSAKVFHDLNYDTVLVDFLGVGESSGTRMTVGYREGEDVAAVLKDAQKQKLQPPFILYGISMGSAAVLKAIALDQAQPDAVILELPYARLVNAVRSRFQVFGVPSFPLCEMTLFWGGVQHGFNALAHNPVEYARSVTVPTLVLQGERDPWTPPSEIQDIMTALRGEKFLTIVPDAGHGLLVTVDLSLWTQSVKQFLSRSKK